MKKAKARRYTAHRDYNVDLSLDLLNTKMRIIDSDFDKTGTIFYEGPVWKFIKERIPAPFLVEILLQLEHQDEITYSFKSGENIIQKLR